jgi:hypothetical protein
LEPLDSGSNPGKPTNKLGEKMCTHDMNHPDGQCEKTTCKKNKNGWCKCMDRYEQHYYSDNDETDLFLKNWNNEG